MNQTQLKSILAKMLPSTCRINSDGELRWRFTDDQSPDLVRDSELLYLVSLVEASLSESEHITYWTILSEFDDYSKHGKSILCATWEHRLESLSNLKGIGWKEACTNHYSDGSKIFPNRDCGCPIETIQ